MPRCRLGVLASESFESSFSIEIRLEQSQQILVPKLLKFIRIALVVVSELEEILEKRSNTLGRNT